MKTKLLNYFGLYTERQMIHQKIDCSLSYKYCNGGTKEVMSAIQNTPLINETQKGWPNKQDLTPSTINNFMQHARELRLLKVRLND